MHCLFFPRASRGVLFLVLVRDSPVQLRQAVKSEFRGGV